MKMGIIGGAGPLASSLLYESVVKECYRLGKNIPEIVLFNYPFTRGLKRHEEKKHLHLLQKELHQAVTFLKKNGAEIGLLACNTLHKHLQDLGDIGIPFLSLPHTVVNEVLLDGKRQVFILGTPNTRAYGLYHHPQLTPIYPNPKEQAQLNTIIDHILAGCLKLEDSKKLSDIIMAQKGCEGVILGCTDLPVLHHHFPLQIPLPIYDSIKIPARTLTKGFL